MSRTTRKAFLSQFLGNPLDLRFAGSFLWDTLSFDIDHDKGIAIYGKVPDPFDLLPGLTWKMEVGLERGAPPAPFSGTGVALLFYIATKDRNYQLRLADGVSILISYTQLTSPDEPISTTAKRVSYAMVTNAALP